MDRLDIHAAVAAATDNDGDRIRMETADNPQKAQPVVVRMAQLEIDQIDIVRRRLDNPQRISIGLRPLIARAVSVFSVSMLRMRTKSPASSSMTSTRCGACR
ncbi:MAG: hypothetical protein IPK19_07575 [Chloroflexi bacterium]|nr:hypothetical protein [Chloroflexota bacterium]